MIFDLTILAKSDKQGGFCVSAITQNVKIIRLVRDSEGHALTEEQCKFEKLYRITADLKHTPLKHQRENYVLNELLKVYKPKVSIDDFEKHLHSSNFVFSNTNPWLSEDEMENQKTTFLFVEIDDLNIYQNDEKRYKANFTYKNQIYEGFSITDPKFKTKERKITKAIILFSLPNSPYNRYGCNLYYKFICAVYPLKPESKALQFDCYKI